MRPVSRIDACAGDGRLPRNYALFILENTSASRMLMDATGIGDADGLWKLQAERAEWARFLIVVGKMHVHGIHQDTGLETKVSRRMHVCTACEISNHITHKCKREDTQLNVQKPRLRCTHASRVQQGS